MATIHLKIDGIDGDSVAAGYEGQIDCDTWGWGAHQPANMHVATGGAAGGSQVQDLRVTKKMDKASANLMKYCCKGNHISEVVMSCTKSSGEAQVEWLKITMTKVIISNVNFNGSDIQTQGGEEISLNFAKFTMEFFEQTETGTQGAAVTAEYDIATQT